MVVLEGGWKLRCESLGSLRYFLHGLVERVGDIVQKQPAVMLSQARASSETPEVTLSQTRASSDHTRSSQPVVCPELPSHARGGLA